MKLNQGARTVSNWCQRTRRLVAEALQPGGHDFTRLPINRSVALLAIPMVLEMAMEAIFAITDIFYVARLGPDAVAAVGLTEAVMTLVYAIAVGLGMGVTALVARRVGEGDGDGAALVTGQTLWLALLCSCLVAALGISFAADLLGLMGAPESVIVGGAMYTRILFGGAFTIVTIFLLNAAFRGAGVPSIAMRALVIANAINIALDPCLIFGLGPFPALGVTGAAVATTFGRSVGVVYLMVKLFEVASPLRLRAQHLKLAPAVMGNLVKVSVGGIGQFLIATASWVVLMRFVATYGSVAIAGYTIAIRIIDFTILPAWGLSNAASTLVGQNLGAKRVQRAKLSVAVVLRYTLGMMLPVGIVFIAFGDALVGIFSNDPSTIGYGGHCLQWVGLGYAGLASGMVLTQAFNGAGDTYTPTVINFICFWLVQLPLAWTLATTAKFGLGGIFFAIFAAENLLALIAWRCYRRGRWQQIAV